MGDKKIKCPVCEEQFELNENLEVGDSTHCPGCYADLKIVNLDPLQVEELVKSFDDYEENEEDSEC